MRLSQKQLRFIIQEELALVLETRRARDWIAKQDESQRDRLMDFYEAGMTNIPDLSYTLNALPRRATLDLDLLKAYYSPEYKDILNQYGIKQLKDFQEQGYAFTPFMQALVDYNLSKDVKSSDVDVSKDAKIIGQVGDWTITDPVSGGESARCAAGTTWCTRTGSTYDRYVEGDVKLYYLSNDKKEYPYNKLSFGVDKRGIRYGGRGGSTVDAANDGIGSYNDAKRIVGDGIDEIISILLDYYPEDMEKRSLQKVNDQKLFLNFINFARKAKKLSDSSQRILFYRRVMNYVYNYDGNVAKFAKHLYKIFDFILKDKEMKNKEFLTQDKKEIMDVIEFHLSLPRFMQKMPLEERIKKFNLIYKSLVNSWTKYYDEEGEEVGPENEGAIAITDFENVYSNLKKIYPIEKVPENIRAVFDQARLKAIKYIEEEMERLRNIRDTITSEFEIEWIDKELAKWEKKLQSLKDEQ